MGGQVLDAHAERGAAKEFGLTILGTSLGVPASLGRCAYRYTFSTAVCLERVVSSPGLITLPSNGTIFGHHSFASSAYGRMALRAETACIEYRVPG
jgi:hypothetical protein